MAITEIKVTCDRTNYARYGDDASLAANASEITATVVAVGAAGGETIAVILQRRARSGPGGRKTAQFQLATATITLDSNGIGQTVFDLYDLYDANGYYQGRHSITFNDWSVLATYNSLTSLTQFSVLPITVEEMRNRWCLGLPLITIERLEVAFQPQLITGVMVSNVSFNSVIGQEFLVYYPAAGSIPPTLMWGNGPIADIVPGQEDYVLYDAGGGSINIAVIAADLPSTTQTEGLFINYGVMPDSTIIRQIIAETNNVERMMHVKLEPALIVGVPTAQNDVVNCPAVYDEIAEAVTYYKPHSLNQWLHIETPFPGLLQVQRLSGFMNQTKVTDIDQAWIKPQEQSGKIDLVPSNAAILNWYLYGPGLWTIFFNYLAVPGFWSFVLIAGLRELPDSVRDYIGLRAAIPLLNQASLARYPAGVTGYSITRDGVSESRTVMPGIYAEQIQQYEMMMGRNEKGQDQMLMDLRDEFRGMISITL